MVNIKETREIMKEYKINPKVITVQTFRKAIMTEMEHIDLIGNDPNKAAVIAIAHLREDPKYYHYLWAQERKREAYWEEHEKPSIFTS